MTGLSTSTTYYFALKTSDEVPNISGLSNVVSGTTLAYTSVKDWNFNTAGNSAVSFEGWIMYYQVSGTVSGGSLNLTSSGIDPQIKSPDLLGITAPATYNKVRIRMQNNSPQTSAQVFFITDSDQTWNATKAKAFTITANSGNTDYVVDMSTVTAWTGTIRQLRIDPLDQAVSSQTVNIDYIRVTDNGGASDTTAPSAVTNLAVGTTTSSTAPLSWTSPGDDGSTGTAASYDIRYATSVITDANWASATQAAGEPAPAVAGTIQSFTVTGLSASTTYYFAIKTSDEVPNVSGLSNVPSGTTTAGSSNLALGKTYSASSQWDTTQTPDKAFDGSSTTNWQAISGSTFNGQWLQVDFGANTTFDKVVLSEYGSRTTGFRIEYWNGTAWATAYTGTAIGSQATPSTHDFTAVTGSKARIYYTSGTSTPIMYEFAVYNQGASDTTAPAAVTNLAVGTTTSSTAPLSWTSPGDDGSTGTAASYDIRYSTSAINDANWASATQATGEPAPAVAGTSQSFTVTGLSASTTYYFAIKTSDEVPNVSALSNVPSGTTAASSETSLITARTLGTLRSNFTGKVGFKYTTPSTAITVTSLGRYFVSGNTGTHLISLYKDSDKSLVASCSVNTSTGTDDGLGFKYCTLGSPVTLLTSTAYDLVSDETSGGDQWYDDDTSITVGTSTANQSAYLSGSTWGTHNSGAKSYGPVNLKY